MRFTRQSDICTTRNVREKRDNWSVTQCRKCRTCTRRPVRVQRIDVGCSGAVRKYARSLVRSNGNLNPCSIPGTVKIIDDDDARVRLSVTDNIIYIFRFENCVSTCPESRRAGIIAVRCFRRWIGRVMFCTHLYAFMRFFCRRKDLIRF